MATQARKPSPDRQITIGEKTYTLRFSLRAMMALQDHYELESLDAVGERLSDSSRMGAEDLAAVLWAGLRTHHSDLSLDDAIDLLDEAGLGSLESIIGDAFRAAAPDKEDGSADEGPRKPGRSTA